jgi:lipopolysaccharide export LptBFGC system permease protein LptF
MSNQMPDDHFPNKSRAKVAVQDAPGESQTSKPRVKHAAETVDWLAWWSLSIALSALVMAAVVYFNDSDTVGASVILAGAAGIVALVLLFSEAPVQNTNQNN